MALILAAFGTGCSTSWEAVDGPTPVSSHADLGLFDRGGAWDAFPEPDGPVVEGRWRALPPEERVTVSVEADVEPAEPAPRAAPPQPVVARAPTLPVPEPRTPEPKGKKDDGPRDLDLRAREHFVRNPTHIRAERVTLVCQPAYRREIRLRGELVEDGAGGTRVAKGNARLVLRELLLEADEIIVRSAKDDVIQILARGGVAFVSRVGDQIVREEGLRSLIVTNDRTLPLR